MCVRCCVRQAKIELHLDLYEDQVKKPVGCRLGGAHWRACHAILCRAGFAKAFT